MYFEIVFFRLAAIALLAVVLLDKQKRSLDCKALSFLLAIGIINAFWHTFNPIVLATLMNTFLAVLIVYIVVGYSKNHKKMYPLIVWAGLINIGMMLLQKIGFNPILNSGNIFGEFGGLMGNAPRLGTYLAITLPIAFKVSPIFFCIYVLAGLALKEIGVVIVGGVLLFIKFKRYRVALIILALIGGYLLREQIIFSIGFRLPIWKVTIERIVYNILQGFGLGMFPHISKQFCNSFTGQQVDFVFNSYLQFIFGAGALGAVWIGYILRKFYLTFKPTTEALSIVAVLILCLFEYPIEIPRLWITITAIVGFYLISTKKEVCDE